MEKTAFFNEKTGKPVGFLLNCEIAEIDSCIPVRASFEHRPALCEKYECVTESDLMRRVDVARVVLGTIDRSNLVASSGGVAFRFNPRIDLPYRLYSQRCFSHSKCR